MPTLRPISTIGPAPQLEGMLYYLRDGRLYAFDLAAGSEVDLSVQLTPPRVWKSTTLHLSPNSAWLALLDQGALSLLNLVTYERTPIDAQDVVEAAWAPDSSALAFCTRRAELWVYELESGTALQIGAGCQIAWSPDGQRLAHIDKGQLVISDRQGAERWIWDDVHNHAAPRSPNLSLYAPFWTADGARVVVTHLIAAECALSAVTYQELVDVTTGASVVIGTRGPPVRAILSPNGEHAALIGISDGIGLPVLGVEEILGEPFEFGPHICLSEKFTLRTEYVSAPLRDIYAAAWSPDGQWLALVHCPYETSVYQEHGLTFHRSRCDHEPQPGTIKLFNPFDATLTDALVEGVDIYSNVQWGRAP